MFDTCFETLKHKKGGGDQINDKVLVMVEAGRWVYSSSPSKSTFVYV